MSGAGPAWPRESSGKRATTRRAPADHRSAGRARPSAGAASLLLPAFEDAVEDRAGDHLVLVRGLLLLGERAYGAGVAVEGEHFRDQW